MISPRHPVLLLAALLALGISACRPREEGKVQAVSLKTARQGFVTQLTKQEKENSPPEPAPPGIFDLVHYTSPAGQLAAYVSPNPTDGKKHPIIIWLVGGFENSISPIAWGEGVSRNNDQSASAYRHAGMAMMYPSLRGGNDNPGHKEGLYGEVDDVLAAADYAAKLPWVDPQRIYLGGHSTGGTLALLTAEAADDTRFRAVIAFGPVESVSLYGQETLPYDVRNAKETKLRASMDFLSAIKSPTLVIEGDGQSANSSSLAALQKRNTNPQIQFTLAAGYTHFSVLAPANAALADKLSKDTGANANLSLSKEEIDAASENLMTANFISAGDIRGRFAQNGVALYHAGDTAKLNAAIHKSLATDPDLKDLQVYKSFDEAERPPFVVIQEQQAPFKEFELPDTESFRYIGRGMSATDISTIQKSSNVTSVWIVIPSARTWPMIKKFNLLAAEWAKTGEAFLWDNLTRECFTQASWKETRIDGWGNEEIADLRTQINMHAYQAEKEKPEVRIITLGMSKFALPDVVIPNAMHSASAAGGDLINLVCQSLASRPVVADPRQFAVDIETLKPASAVAGYREKLAKGGTGKATLSLMASTPEEGDEDNAQIALDFRQAQGATNVERYSSTMNELWGSGDTPFTVKRDQAIEKASEVARERLKKIAPQFSKGIPERTQLMVKAPFSNADGKNREYMWVEVRSWKKGEPVKGILQNDPMWVKELRRGAAVEIDPDEVFDYILTFPDGAREGGEAEKLLDKQ